MTSSGPTESTKMVRGREPRLHGERTVPWLGHTSPRDPSRAIFALTAALLMVGSGLVVLSTATPLLFTGVGPLGSLASQATSSSSSTSLTGSGATSITPLSGGTAHGIDVSSVNGFPSWSTISRSGIGFAFAKATQGAGYTNPAFGYDMASGRSSGVVMGAYDFACPVDDSADYCSATSASAEADHFLSVAGPYFKSGNMLPALDVEVGCGQSTSSGSLSNWVNSWATIVEAYAAHKGFHIVPIIYMNSNYASNCINPSLTKYHLWVADWGAASPDTGHWSSWSLWQTSDCGSVPGITATTCTDLDVFHGDLTSLRSQIVFGGSTPAKVPVEFFVNSVTAGCAGNGCNIWKAAQVSFTVSGPGGSYTVTSDHALQLEAGQHYAITVHVKNAHYQIAGWSVGSYASVTLDLGGHQRTYTATCSRTDTPSTTDNHATFAVGTHWSSACRRTPSGEHVSVTIGSNYYATVPTYLFVNGRCGGCNVWSSGKVSAFVSGDGTSFGPFHDSSPMLPLAPGVDYQVRLSIGNGNFQVTQWWAMNYATVITGSGSAAHSTSSGCGARGYSPTTTAATVTLFTGTHWSTACHKNPPSGEHITAILAGPSGSGCPSPTTLTIGKPVPASVKAGGCALFSVKVSESDWASYNYLDVYETDAAVKGPQPAFTVYAGMAPPTLTVSGAHATKAGPDAKLGVLLDQPSAGKWGGWGTYEVLVMAAAGSSGGFCLVVHLSNAQPGNTPACPSATGGHHGLLPPDPLSSVWVSCANFVSCGTGHLGWKVTTKGLEVNSGYGYPAGGSDYSLAQAEGKIRSELSNWGGMIRTVSQHYGVPEINIVVESGPETSFGSDGVADIMQALPGYFDGYSCGDSAGAQVPDSWAIHYANAHWSACSGSWIRFVSFAAGTAYLGSQDNRYHARWDPLALGPAYNHGSLTYSTSYYGGGQYDAWHLYETSMGGLTYSYSWNLAVAYNAAIAV